jgi:hypothetical protein
MPLIGDQLACRKSTVRESMILLTIATWPSRMAPWAWKLITAHFGVNPRS